MEFSKEAKAKRNEYLREWHKKNPEKSAAIKARYWEKKAAQSGVPEEMKKAQDEPELALRLNRIEATLTVLCGAVEAMGIKNLDELVEKAFQKVKEQEQG